MMITSVILFGFEGADMTKASAPIPVGSLTQIDISSLNLVEQN